MRQIQNLDRIPRRARGAETGNRSRIGLAGKTRLIVLPVILSAALLSCSRKPSETAQSAPEGPGVRTEMLVSAGWLEGNLGQENLVLLQVADSSADYHKSHIPGALYLRWKDIVVDRDGVPNELPDPEQLTALVQRLGITENSRIVLYDQGDGVQAARAYVTLDYLGLGGVTALLDGQLKKWTAEGRPVNSEVPEIHPSSFVPHFNPEIIVSLDEMRKLVESGDTGACLVDARSPEQYSGKETGHGSTRGGHIPGAENLPWQLSIVSADDPVFKPADELRKLYAGAGASSGRPVITYCNTGRTASQDYFVLKYLGYNTRLYDGSFSQWSTAEETPVQAGAEQK
ncbi:MAG: hypothetical protein A3F83_12615 [Candidatus Glassbacteria bacterium RIFCSPLOWO2_12_FULL_58_11]|uniref:Rhodanese domain-containing protein n=1 Tax=Candidatus Glassbacteria bacterium RIFCSPLOWO2_12_FULL_58_11 TaxID=1817867 RepID=A0A1F5YTJ8_9BACT|nr:MAG: hypothetical protein A3F83_12615 [Candidatus Glassbacteria bacterium RIFCSPLOWO2_12_FULL_58_11]